MFFSLCNEKTDTNKFGGAGCNSCILGSGNIFISPNKEHKSGATDVISISSCNNW